MPSELLKQVPTAFISYSWDNEEHKSWVKRLGARLRSDGIDLTLDEWTVAPGDQLPRFMETAIRESDFVLVVCTPRYMERSNRRKGGVGYEGNIITAELMTSGNERKFIPLLRTGEWRESAPSWLLGKVYIDLRGDPYPEQNYQLLLDSLRGILPAPPPLGGVELSQLDSDIDMVGVTHQKVYADFLNAALRVHEAAKNRVILKKQGASEAARLMLPRVERDLEDQGRRVKELMHEIHLFASEGVGKAAGEIVGWVLAFEISSVDPQLEPKLDEAFQSLISESLPKFRAEVRRELNARSPSP